MTLGEFKTRDDLGHFLNRIGLVHHGVEIGIAHGAFSRIILSSWKGLKLFMVDPLEMQDVGIYKEDQSSMNFSYYALFDIPSVIKDYPGRAEWIRKYSNEAHKFFKNKSLDFVYIDGNHSFEAVTEDIENWFPKVVSGGLFGGHDFYDSTDWPHWSEVKRAVTTWSKKHGFTVVDKPCFSWFMIKP